MGEMMEGVAAMGNNDIRRALFKSAPPESRKVLFTAKVDGTELKVNLIRPSIKDRNEIYRRFAKGEDGQFSIDLDFSIHVLIQVAHNPDSGERLFTEADFESLVAQPAGSVIDEMANEALKVLNVAEDERKEMGKG